MGISQSGISVDPFLFALKCRIYTAASIILVNAFYSKSLRIHLWMPVLRSAPQKEHQRPCDGR